MNILRMRFLRLAGLALAGAAGVFILVTAKTSHYILTCSVVTTNRADAALVLGASTWKGHPSAIFVERIRHAMDLYREGRVKKILFSGGQCAVDIEPNAVSARDFAISNGIPSADIVIEPWSQTTLENVAYSKDVAARHGLHTFLVVSDPLHLPRAMRIANEYGLQAWPSATPTTWFSSSDRKQWFLRQEVRNFLQFVLVDRFLPVPPHEVDQLALSAAIRTIASSKR